MHISTKTFLRVPSPALPSSLAAGEKKENRSGDHVCALKRRVRLYYELTGFSVRHEECRRVLVVYMHASVLAGWAEEEKETGRASLPHTVL